MKNKKTGLLALLGIGAGAFAFWKYNNMTPAEKAKLKSKVNDAGDKLKRTAHDVENSLNDKYDSLKNSATEKYGELKGKAKSELNDLEKNSTY